MKFFRLIILILLSLSLPILGLAIWTSMNAVHFSSDFWILIGMSIIFVIFIFLLSWFFLNIKTKSVGGILGGILSIFLIIFGIYTNNSRFGSTKEDVLMNYGDAFEKIFPLSENILDVSLQSGKFDKNMFPKNTNLPEMTSLEKNFYNFFSYNYSSIYRYADENSKKFPTITLLQEIRKDLQWKDGYKKNYMQILEKISQIKNLQNSNEYEKNAILSSEYWMAYENFINLLKNLSDEQKQYMYITRWLHISKIVSNHLILLMSFWEKKFFHESVKIFEELIAEQKMENYFLENDTPTTVFGNYLIIDSQLLRVLFFARDFEIPKENFENILRILEKNNRKKEFENIYKMEFAWDVKNLDTIEKEGKIRSIFYEWKISKKYWDKAELITFLEHFYTEKAKRITGESEPKTIFSDMDDFDSYVHAMYEKYNAEKDNWKILFRKIEKNHFSRLYSIIVAIWSASANALFERIEDIERSKTEIFRWK